LLAGCHPNRDTRGAIERADFTFEHIDVFDLPARLVLTRPFLEAVAVRRD
jgi:hypothetical protein